MVLPIECQFSKGSPLRFTAKAQTGSGGKLQPSTNTNWGALEKPENWGALEEPENWGAPLLAVFARSGKSPMTVLLELGDPRRFSRPRLRQDGGHAQSSGDAGVRAGNVARGLHKSERRPADRIQDSWRQP